MSRRVMLGIPPRQWQEEDNWGSKWRFTNYNWLTRVMDERNIYRVVSDLSTSEKYQFPRGNQCSCKRDAKDSPPAASHINAIVCFDILKSTSFFAVCMANLKRQTSIATSNQLVDLPACQNFSENLLFQQINNKQAGSRSSSSRPRSPWWLFSHQCSHLLPIGGCANATRVLQHATRASTGPREKARVCVCMSFKTVDFEVQGSHTGPMQWAKLATC